MHKVILWLHGSQNGLICICFNGHKSVAGNSQPYVRLPWQFTSTELIQLYSWVERSTARVKCLVQKHNKITLAGARTWTARSRVRHANHWVTKGTHPLLDERKLWCRKKATHTYRCLFVNRFDDKFLVIKGDVSDLTPRKSNLRGQPGYKSMKCDFSGMTSMKGFCFLFLIVRINFTARNTERETNLWMTRFKLE